MSVFESIFRKIRELLLQKLLEMGESGASWICSEQKGGQLDPGENLSKLPYQPASAANTQFVPKKECVHTNFMIDRSFVLKGNS